MRSTLHIIVVLVLLAVIPTAHALFSDIPKTHPYVEAIDYLTREGILQGYDDRTFHPDSAINRAEFTTILMRMLYPTEYTENCLEDLQDTTLYLPEMTFPDVPHDAWFANSICTAWVNGTVSGFPNGMFRPEEGVKFVEAAKMLALGFGLTGIELPNLGDANLLWFTPYVEILSERNAIPASISSLVHPITRSEMAEMLYRLRNYPLELAPVSTYSLQREDLPVYPVDWKLYKNNDYGFALYYPNVWPEPQAFPRGIPHDGIPNADSIWSMYFGPDNADACIRSGTCVERDMWLDVFPLTILDFILDDLETDPNVTFLEDYPENPNVPSLTFLEASSECVSKRGFLIGRDFVYGLTIKCGGETDSLSHVFDRLMQGWHEITLH